MIAKGKLITLEGVEGVGKSSNVQFVAELLKASGKEVVVTREPGGTEMAEAIRKILLSEHDEIVLPKTELLLLYAARWQHVEHVIRPALEAGRWVVCDRFSDATFAYQGGGRQVAKSEIQTLHHWTLGNFEPDCTILLDAPVEVAFERIREKRQLDRFEKEHQVFFERIRAAYLEIADNAPRMHIVDAAQSLPDVQNQIKVILETL